MRVRERSVYLLRRVISPSPSPPKTITSLLPFSPLSRHTSFKQWLVPLPKILGPPRSSPPQLTRGLLEPRARREAAPPSPPSLGNGSWGKLSALVAWARSNWPRRRTVQNRQATSYPYYCVCHALTWLFDCRSRARSFLEAPPTTPTMAAPTKTRNEMITPRRSGPPERLPSSPYSTIHTFVACAMSSEQTTIGICCLNM